MDTALRREVTEETGLDVQLGRVVGSAQWESPERVVAYLLLEAAAQDNDVRLSDEHDKFCWVPCV